MKKTLITSTALVLLAGAAAAQVSFSGYGRFGLGYSEANGEVPGGEDTALISRFRLNIDGNAVTDGGVEFSARVRLQADDRDVIGEQAAAGLNGARFTTQYGGFRVDVGNVGGIFDSGLIDYYGYEQGLTYFTGQYVGVDYDFLGYSSTGSGSNAVFASYQNAGFQFGASYDPNDTNLQPYGDRWDIGGSYTFNNFKLGLAYGENEINHSLFVATLGAEFDRFSGFLFLGDEDLDLGANEPDVDGMVYGLSVSFDVGAATSINASYGSGDGESDDEGYALGFVQDLGGGVQLKGGIGYNGPKDGDDGIVADLGVEFAF